MGRKTHHSPGSVRLFCTLLLLTTGIVAHAQFSFIEVIRDGVEGIDGLNTPSHVVISPDNKHLYVAGAGDNAIAIFERDTLSGALTFVEAVKSGENGIDGLAGVREIALSADGQYLYAVADVDGAITTFSRNEDGKLVFKDLLKDGVDGVDGLGGARALAMSPDGDNIYVAASLDDAVSVFSVNRANGFLTYVDNIKDSDAAALELDAANGVVVSPDNNHVYVIGNMDDGVSVFERDTNNQGRLTNIQNINNWAEFNFLGTLIGNVRPTDVVISDDGENVYISGYGGSYAGNLTVFSRNKSTGNLTIEKKLADETSDDPTFTQYAEFGRLTSLAFNSENSFVYTTGDDSDDGLGDDPDFRILSFERTSFPVFLAPFKGIYNNAAGVEGLELPTAITFSIEGNFFYVVATAEHALTTFSVLFPSIASFSPQEGYTDTEVSITGDDFGNVQGNSTVKLGNVTAEVVAWSNTEIVVKVPEMDGGEVDINVTVNNITTSSSEKFTVIESSVVIDTFAPMVGKTGTRVGIKGTNFGTSSDERKVFFGDVEATDTVWISSDSITAVVPSMEDGSVKIKVMVNNAVGISNSDFIVDNTSPVGVITYSDTDRKVHTGEIIIITATFNEPVADDPGMNIAFNSTGQDTVGFPMTKISETVYTYAYEAKEDDRQISIHLLRGTDVYGNIVEVIPQNSVFFIDNSSPIPIFSPAHKVDEVATDVQIEISFDEEVRIIDNSTIRNHDLQQAVTLTKILTTTEELIAFTGTYDESTFSIKIIPASLEINEVYQVKIEGSLLEDEADNPVDGRQIRFTTGKYEGLSPEPHQDFLNQDNEDDIWIDVNDGGFVRTAQLYARGINSCGDWQGPFNLVLSNFRYKFDEINDFIGIEYYYSFIDKFDSIYTDTLYIYKEIAMGIDVDVQAGESQKAYQIISFPLELDSNGITQVFNELEAYKKENWRLFTIGNQEQFIEYPDFQSVKPGEAYLLIYKDPDIATISTGKGHTVNVHKNKPYEIPVHPGWNLIGNPYNFNIPWETIMDFQNEEGTMVLNEIREYSENWEIIADTLPRSGGSLVFVHGNASSIKIPVSCNNDGSGGRKKDKDISKNNWEISLSLKQENGHIKRTTAGFGMHMEADNSRDKSDVMSPPHFGDYLDINFNHPEYFYPYFAKDIVPFQDSYIWEFSMETNIATDLFTLSWNEKDLPADGKQIYLMDVSKNKVVDMHNNPSYTFHTANTNKFKIFYGTQAFIDANVYPDAVSLHVNYPNPFYEHTSIPFTIPKSEKGYHVKMHIYHISGKQMVTLKDEVVHSGFYEIRWDGTDASGHKMKSGIYICELVAEDGERIVKKENRLLLLGP